MTLRHFEIYVTVYNEMSITKAARKLYVTQPSVSFAIKEMEEFYNVKLFNRINRRIFATEKGECLYEYARKILQMADKTKQIICEQEGPTKIHIGSSVTIGNTLLPVIIKKIQNRYMNSEIKLTVQNSNDIVKAVLKNELDMGFVEDKIESSQLEEVSFYRDCFAFVCRSRHPLSEENMDINDVCTYPFFLREYGSGSRDVFENIKHSFQRPYSIMCESISNQSIIQLLKVTDGISVLPLSVVKKEVEDGTLICLPVYPKEFERQFSFIYHKGNIHSAIKSVESILEALD